MSCPICGKPGTIENGMESLCKACKEIQMHQELLKQIKKRSTRAGVPSRYLDATLNDFDEEYPVDQGLFITGRVGCGKTHLLAALCRNKLLKKANCLFINAPLWFLSLKEDLDHSYEKIRQASTVECLFIDDIGAERVTDYVFETWYLVLESRYREGLYTSVTLNSVDTLDERLFRRLRDSTVLIEMEENEH